MIGYPPQMMRVPPPSGPLVLADALSASAPVFFRSTEGSYYGAASTAQEFHRDIQGSTVNLVAVGDSITAWPFATYFAQAWLALAANGVKASLGNISVSGWKITQFPTTEIDALHQAGKTNILVVFGGTNDLAFDVVTGTVAHTRLADYCTARGATWENIVVCNMLKRKATDFPESERVAFNNLLSSNYSSYADAKVEWAADAAFSDVTDTTYYQDLIHPTQLGHNIMAGYLNPIITSLL